MIMLAPEPVCPDEIPAGPEWFSDRCQFPRLCVCYASLRSLYVSQPGSRVCVGQIETSKSTRGILVACDSALKACLLRGIPRAWCQSPISTPEEKKWIPFLRGGARLPWLFCFEGLICGLTAGWPARNQVWGVAVRRQKTAPVFGGGQVALVLSVTRA